MKELNLYPLKRKKVKLLTFVIYILIMLLPSIAAYYMLDVYWDKEVDAYNVIYAKALHIIDYKLKGTSQDITVLKRASETFRIKASVLKARQKETMDFIKESFVSKKVIKEVFNIWQTQKDEWMVLKELKWDNKSLDIDMYRVYNPSNSPNLEELKSFLRKVGKVKTHVIFNVGFIDKIKLERVVLSLNASSNR